MFQNINAEYFTLSIWGVFSLTWSGLYIKHAFSHKKLAWSNQKTFNGGIYISGTLACIMYLFTQKGQIFVNVPILLIGMLLLFSGFLFALWARLKMGKAWSIHTVEHTSKDLLTEGPFKYVRHPIYSGQLMMTIGTGLTLNNIWVTVVFFFFTWILHSFRCAKEEAILNQATHGEYNAVFKKKSRFFPALPPLIYRLYPHPLFG